MGFKMRFVYILFQKNADKKLIKSNINKNFIQNPAL